jgi:hypothetical protein
MPADRDALEAFTARIEPRGSADEARRRGDQLRRRRRVLTSISACAIVLALVGGVAAVADRVNESSQTNIIDTPSTVLDDPNRPGWTQLESPPLSNRGRPAVAWTGSEIFVWGGASPGEPLLDGALYDPMSKQWRPIPAPPAELTGVPMAAVATDRDVVVIARDDDRDVAQAAAFNASDGAWRMLPSPPVDLGDQTSAGWTGDEVLLYSAYVGQTDAIGYAYAPAADAWRALPDPPFAPSSGPRAFMLDDALVVLDGPVQTASDPGGAAGGGPYAAAVYEPTTDSWQDLPPHDPPGLPIPWPLGDAQALVLTQGCEGWCPEATLLDATNRTWEAVDASPFVDTIEPMMVTERLGGELMFWDMSEGVAFSGGTRTWRALPVAPVLGLETQWGRSVDIGDRVIRVSSRLSSDNPAIEVWQYLPEETPTTSAPAQTDPATIMHAVEFARIVSRFAQFPVDEVVANLPTRQQFMLRNEIRLAHGSDVTATITADEMSEPSAWEIPRRDGEDAVSIVELLRSADELITTLDRSTTCAAQATSDPPGTEDGLRISIVGTSGDDCSDWFAIDIFVGGIQPTVIRLDRP